MKTCIIVDDEYLAIKVIKKYLADRTDIICVNCFTDPNEAVIYLKGNTIDLVILDIEMPVSGLDFRNRTSKNIAIIFTTASPNYAIEAFNQNAVDYLLKPVDPDRFYQALDKAILLINASIANEFIATQKQVVLTLKSNKRIHKVLSNEIIFIESLREYIQYNTVNDKILAIGALKDVYLNGLPEKNFIRIHKSYIINKNFITSFNLSTVTLNNNITLAIGRVYKDDFVKTVNTSNNDPIY